MDKKLPKIKLIEVMPGTSEAKTLISFYQMDNSHMITDVPKSDADLERERKNQKMRHFLVMSAEPVKSYTGIKIPAGTIVGVCGYEIKQDKKGEYIYLRRGLVIPPYRRVHFGEAAVKAREKLITKHKIKRIQVATRFGNDISQKMILASGFKRTGFAFWTPKNIQDIPNFLFMVLQALLEFRLPIKFYFEKYLD